MNKKKKIYRGTRSRDNGQENVVVTVNEQLLKASPDDSLDSNNRTFDWGNSNQGSFNLAYAILLDYFSNDKINALKFCKEFQERVINIIDNDTWEISSINIKYEIKKINIAIRDEQINLVRKNALCDYLEF